MILEWFTTTERPKKEVDLIKRELKKAIHLPGHPVAKFKVICWWCNTFIRGDKDADDEHTRHEVCSRCKKAQQEAAEKLRHECDKPA